MAYTGKAACDSHEVLKIDTVQSDSVHAKTYTPIRSAAVYFYLLVGRRELNIEDRV